MSKKISELTDVSTLDGNEQLEVVQSGANKKVTVNDLLPVQLQGDKTIDLNGKILYFKVGSNGGFSINDEGYVIVGSLPDVAYLWAVINPNTNDVLEKVDIDNKQSFLGMVDNGMVAKVTFTAAQAGPGEAASSFNLASTFNDNVNPPTTVGIGGNAQTKIITYVADNHVFADLVAKDFADDAAASGGGVPVGGLYHTSGTVKIRLI